jgi:hypothetical protein
MKRQTGIFVRGQLLIIAGLIAAVIASNHSAFAGTTNVKGSYAETFVTTNFSYDGISPAITSSHADNDNIGGPFSGQMLVEYLINGNPCMAPDGSAGASFVVVQVTLADNYNQGHIYYAGAGAAAGGGCASNTTGRVGATITLSVVGGTRKFANASGSITLTITAQVLAGSSSPFQLFGDSHVTKTGSITD